MGGHPVQDDADAGLVELIHQPHEVVWGAEAAGGREVAGALIAPGGVQGMLRDGEQLHMGEAHLLYVGHQIPADVPVGEHLVVAGAPPGAQMYLIDVHGLLVDRVVLPVIQPTPVAPLITGQIVQLGGGAGAGLGMEGIGVGLGQDLARAGVHSVFIVVILLQAGEEELPHAALQGGHGVGPVIPAVEVAHYGDGLSMRSPDAEQPAGLSAAYSGVGAQEFLRPDRLSRKELRQGRGVIGYRHRCHSLLAKIPKKRAGSQEILVIGDKITPEEVEIICINYTT